MCPDTRVSAYVSVYDLVCSVCATLYTVYFRAVFAGIKATHPLAKRGKNLIILYVDV